ncbi:cell division and transport-associated protein TolQ [Desulfuromonas soudanensis]|uniref:Cell division and transport-associated protein TolQ n=1 Tax=Desulfuromonas soudanensis TaxID=1603606 RepID=A0A0M3QGN0_9BACT|nr:protein TolQ [Desulfuromonas soudanensis]ALC18279.1 cell division and transport-associated protein TolQ [Desulfuromonas soudanensis]
MDLILNAGLVVKLVLLILVYFSVVSWAIIFHKLRVIHRAASDSERFLEFFWSKKRFDVIGQGLKDYAHSPLAVLFREGYQEMVKGQRPREGEESAFHAEGASAENVSRALRRAMTQETHRLEKYLTFLATTGSTAPFIGLFGTVWGIMDSFHGIGKTGSASLAVVAPGISEALVATAIGLVAAIPAVVAYNHFLNKVNVLTGEMDNFSQEFLNIVQRMVRRG